MKQLKSIALCCLALVMGGCESMKYSALEKVGIHKRDILIDRIEDTQEAQEEGQEQFKSALEQFRSVVAFDGGELERMYQKFDDEYRACEDAANDISEHIDSVETVADALFNEWQNELNEYQNAKLRRASEKQLNDTKQRYRQILGAMRQSERAVQPVLAILHDNVLFLKHNLNARAVGSLRGELANIDREIAQLTQSMQRSITESQRFIDSLKDAP
ncbi:MAG: hypothetical protein RL336_1146 [Pseudomonadota bacterium]|jgi:hypothetical protein